MRINDEAVTVFVHASRLGLMFRSISLFEFDRRMAVLDMLLADDLDDRVIPANLLDRMFGVEGEEPRVEEDADVELSVREAEGEGTEENVGASEDDGESRGPPPAPPFVHFVPRPVLGEAWDFHPHDDDYWPSIPHGHLDGRRLPNMNPYIGRAFEAPEQEVKKHRLTKKEMVELWNYDKFRDIVLKAVDYYATTYPDYAFPVPHPTRLPRPWRRYSAWRKYL